MSYNAPRRKRRGRIARTVGDILGLFGAFTPKSVKRYADLGEEVSKAVSRYAADVRARRFPDEVFTLNYLPRAGELR